MTTSQPIVETRALTKTFGEGPGAVHALRGIDLKLAEGEFVAVMGPSGSGKSTLLHLIGGLDTPSSGTVCIGGQDLCGLNDDELTLVRRRRIGFVFQAYNLLGVLSALENVSLPLEIDGVRESDARLSALASLKRVGMDHRRDHLPGQLSGGEQQRVAMARALVAGPLLLLADEPTGNLDSGGGDRIIGTLRQLADDNAQTILMVTHNASHAAVADRIVRLKDGCVIEEQLLGSGRSPKQVLADLESST